MKQYNKLVRDNIPNIIQADGRAVNIRILNNEDYKKELNSKLKEELAEYLKDNNVEELADIVEVIYGLLKSMKITKQEFEEIRKNKNKKNGAFNKKIFLIEAEEKKENKNK